MPSEELLVQQVMATSKFQRYFCCTSDKVLFIQVFIFTFEVLDFHLAFFLVLVDFVNPFLKAPPDNR